MKLSKLLIAFLLNLAITTSAFSDYVGANWKLEISLEKDTYILREPIWLDVILTNTCGDTIRSWGLFPPCQDLGFNIEVIDSVGNPLPYKGPIYELFPLEGFLLLPGEKFYDSFELLETFATKDITRFKFGMFPPGNYHVRATYLEEISNNLTFAVVGVSENEIEAEKLLIDAYKTARMESSESAIPALFNMLELHPKSVYAEIAARGLLNGQKFLERFPNSGYTKTSLEDGVREFSPEKKKEYLKNVIKKYKGTRAAKHAEQMLKLLEK